MKAQDCSSEDNAGVVKSAVRTLEILEYFDEVRHPLNVVGVATALGYPQSSTAALLRSLTSMGYLRYNRTERTYMPTDRVPFLGSWIDPPLFEEAALPRLMRAVGTRTGQLVALAARNDDMAQYIHVLNEPAAVSHHIKIGAEASARDLRRRARLALRHARQRRQTAISTKSMLTPRARKPASTFAH